MILHNTDLCDVHDSRDAEEIENDLKVKNLIIRARRRWHFLGFTSYSKNRNLLKNIMCESIYDNGNY